jgi:phospholipase/lecithinase/hemolysin
MNGNITKEGIKLDLEWMERVGLGGFEIIDASLTTPQCVDKRLVYMSPGWRDAFKYATTLGHQMGMEETIPSSPGWSETGGPWVPPSQAMKKYVWSETYVKGGQPFTGKLLHPPANTGAFQDMRILDDMASPGDASRIPHFYSDTAVIAYRRPASDLPFEALHPKVTASAGTPDVTILNDGDLKKSVKLPIPKVGESAWIEYQFPGPHEIRSVTIAMKEVDWFSAIVTRVNNPEITLEASDDGLHFRAVAELPDGGAPEHTASFPPVNAKFFRVTFKRIPVPPAPTWLAGLDPSALGLSGEAPTDYEIAELELRSGARVNRYEDKAGFAPIKALPNLYEFATPAFATSDVIPKSGVIDLTSKLRKDGSLDWTPPSGDWVVLWFGYSLLGITNHPAMEEATGLEVDKLNATSVKSYMNTYLESFEKTVGADWMGKRGIQSMTTDSWEAGSQNWTDDMIAQFTKRRGYDPLPWLPVLAGHVVESAEASDRFLWDFRKTISDLIADEHYGGEEESLKKRGLSQYVESHEYGRAFIGDGMEVKKFSDIPMGAMWTQVPGVNEESYDNNADDRETASVAHIYGKTIAAAESMTAATAAWAWSPGTLKPTADMELANGINRFVIHESTHQPLTGKAPGLTLGPFGQWFNRNETWAEQAGPWIDYLTRSSYMLQQGRFDADLVYFYGEDSNLTAIFSSKAPEIPEGYGFDYINADGLIHELAVSDRMIRTKSGMSYRVLGLDSYSRHMSLPVLRAIYELVVDGAIVAGSKPIDDPSLADDPTEFKELSDELFGDGTGVHKLGKGAVYAGYTGQRLSEVFNALGVAPDFEYVKPKRDTRLLFAHRKLADGDLYFVDNRSNRDEQVDATFRLAGKAPELWHADTGKSEPASFKIAEGRTTIPLHLEPWGALFVLFREATTETSRSLPASRKTELETLQGPWRVSFQPGRGAPASITLEKLRSWTESNDPGVKYFSGTGTYTTTIAVRADWLKNHARLWIDLGDVKNLAEVTVNGKSLGVLWHAPYRVDATLALKPGANQISIRITNAWVNRLIGDQQPNATTKFTFTTFKPYAATSPLQPSGLLGPVRLYSTATQSENRAAGHEPIAPYDRMYVFGDSYSDIGEGYLDSNGPTAVAYLAERLGFKLWPSNASNVRDKSLDFAVSGAQSGSGSGSAIKGALVGYGMQNQVGDFARKVRQDSIKFNPDRTLFFIAGGLNDGESPGGTTETNEKDEIRTLYKLGARHFEVALLPAEIPEFSATAKRVNPELALIPDQMKTELQDADMKLSNWGLFFDDVLLHAQFYGITNSTDACAGREIFDENRAPCAMPETYFYYHAGHPSTATHRVVGDKLYTEIMKANQPDTK